MLFSHDTVRALGCVVDLVNSAPEASGSEQLPDLDALGDFVSDHQISEVTRLTRDDLRAVHDLRPLIRQVFTAGSDEQAVGAINELVSRALVAPHLTDHDGHPWHVHYAAPGASLADRLAVDSGMALAQVVSTDERERLRRCAAPDCDQVLVDLSRNRSKRYCDARTCGNRLHVAAYRERQRAGG